MEISRTLGLTSMEAMHYCISYLTYLLCVFFIFSFWHLSDGKNVLEFRELWIPLDRQSLDLQNFSYQLIVLINHVLDMFSTLFLKNSFPRKSLLLCTQWNNVEIAELLNPTYQIPFRSSFQMESLCSGRVTLGTGLGRLRGTRGQCGGWPLTTMLPAQPQQLQTSLRRWDERMQWLPCFFYCCCWGDCLFLLITCICYCYFITYVLYMLISFPYFLILYPPFPSPSLPPSLPFPSLSLTFSLPPQLNLSTNNSTLFQVWDAVAGEELHTFSHSHIVKTVDFSSDSTELLTGSNEKLLKIFDLGKPEAGMKLMHIISIIVFV